MKKSNSFSKIDNHGTEYGYNNYNCNRHLANVKVAINFNNNVNIKLYIQNSFSNALRLRDFKNNNKLQYILIN